MISINEYWMKHAILAAKIAESFGEVPVGSIIIYYEKIIGFGWNSCIMHNNVASHAEIIAIKNSGNFLKNYRLNNTSIYITHEPCYMCTLAIINARIKKVFFGSYSHKECSFLNFLKKKNIKHHIKEIKSGILLYECSILLKNFFKKRR